MSRASVLLGGFEDRGVWWSKLGCVVSTRAISNHCRSESVHLVLKEVYSSASFDDGA